MDAITLLKNDHKTVERLFKRFEKAGDRAFVEKREIVDLIIEELSRHAAIEEQLFYPVTRATVPDTEDIALESLEEHHIVKWVLSELQTLPAEDERFDAKVTVLIENVRHHVEEEEEEFFPKVRDELGRKALDDLGNALEEAKRVAPTHPHPRASDTPPGNLVMGVAAGVADRVGDAVSGLAQGGVTAVGDVIATILQRKKPRVSPTGTKAARSTAKKVRSRAADATESVTDAKRKTQRKAKDAKTTAARKAKRTTGAATSGAKRTARAAESGARETGKAARAGAKGTSTSVRRSTKKASTTAKRAATTTARTARRAASSTGSTAKGAARKTAAAAKA